MTTVADGLPCADASVARHRRRKWLILLALLFLAALAFLWNWFNPAAIDEPASSSAIGNELTAPDVAVYIEPPRLPLAPGEIELSGQAAPNSMLELTLDGQPIGTALVDATGTWTYPLTLPTSGQFTLAADNLAGDGTVISQTSTLELTVSEIVSTSTQVGEPEINLPEGTQTVGSIPITGSGVPNGKIELFLDESYIGTTTVDDKGRWQFNYLALNAGDFELSAEMLDADGNNRTKSANYPLSITTVGATGLAPTLDLPDAGNISLGPYELRGQGLPGTTVELLINGDTSDLAPVDDDGRWQYSLDLSEPGPYTIVASTLDQDGLVVAAAQETTFTVGESDGNVLAETSGVSSTEAITSAVALTQSAALSQTQTVSTTVVGEAESIFIPITETAQIPTTGTITAPDVATLDANPEVADETVDSSDTDVSGADSPKAGSITESDRTGSTESVTDEALEAPEGTASTEATASSGVEETSASEADTSSANSGADSGTDESTDADTDGAIVMPEIDSDADDETDRIGDSVEESIGDNPNNNEGDGVEPADRVVSESEVSLLETDAAPLEILLPEGDIAPGLVALSGSAVPESKVELLIDDESAGIALVDSDGRWDYFILLSEVGTYRLRANIVDEESAVALGGVDVSIAVAESTTTESATTESATTESATTEPTVARPAPQIITPTINLPTSNLPTDELQAGPVELSGTGAPLSTVKLSVDDNVVAVGPVDQSGRWVATVNLTEPGTYTITAQVLGADGEVAATSTPVEISVGASPVQGADEIPTVALTTTARVAGQIALGGTAIPNGSLQVLINGQPITTTVGAADGTWTYTTSLNAGEHQIVVNALDKTGEVIATSPALQLRLTEPPNAEGGVGSSGTESSLETEEPTPATAEVDSPVTQAVADDGCTHGTDQGQIWQVGPCDTLWYISQQTSVNLQDLLTANPSISNENIIFLNQQIALPGR